MLIHLIRHTTPEVDLGLCYGSSDLALADTFEQERGLVLAKLSSNYDAVFSSPLYRCEQLSNYVNATQRFVDKRLIEYDFGDWELKPWSDFTDDQAKLWMDNFVEQPAPNGDSLVSMKKRVDEFWHELTNKKLKKIAVVSHAGVLRIIHANILETPLEKVFRLQLNYGAVLEIQYDAHSGMQTVKHL
jgi:alpha-ribazole phosphatase